MLMQDESRCPGVGDDVEGWREGCEHCLRRTTPPKGPQQRRMAPPAIIVFCCPFEWPAKEE